MAEKTSVAVATPNLNDTAQCQICNLFFEDISNYAYHLESKEHAKETFKRKYGEKYIQAKLNVMAAENVNCTVYETNYIEKSENAEVYSCETCKKVCTGATNYKLHLLEKNHRKNLKKAEILQQLKKENIRPENIAPVENIPHISNDSPHCLTDKLCENNNKNDLTEVPRCQVCSKSFSGLIQYTQHIQSELHSRHVLNAENLKNYQNLFIRCEDGNIECKECKKHFNGPEPFIAHMKSPIHSKLKQKKDLLKSLLDKHPEMVVMSSHANEDKGSIDVTESGIFCSSCHNVFSGPETARDHFQSPKHKKVVEEKKRFEQYKLLRADESFPTISKGLNECQISIHENVPDTTENLSGDFEMI